jgi:poly-beta-1,6-N-acetyl-D-glucosamine synthase
MNRLAYVVITPVRDEAAHIGRTIDSVLSQTTLPQRWIVVDDGSTDKTAEIVEQRCQQVPWVTVVRRRDRGYRAAGSGVMEAFRSGYSLVENESWDFIVKLDGDLSFGADYFEQCLSRFLADANLGIAGGTVCKTDPDGIHVDSVGDPPFHVRGATKIYRRSCWFAIAPLASAPGWDTVDEVKANQLGWATRTFPDLQLIQHKPTGAAAGAWSDAFKNGRANYMTGYHPVFMLAKCARRALRKQSFLEAAALIAGYSTGYLRRIPRHIDDETVRYIRRQQIQRMLLRPSIYG